jgi:mono/diheme cytochrome c family protein
MTLGICGIASTAMAVDLEPGAGSDIVMRACSNCHAIDNVLQVRKNRADWDTTVHLMRNYGMEMSDEDMQMVIDYLSSHYGFQPRKQAAK